MSEIPDRIFVDESEISGLGRAKEYTWIDTQVSKVKTNDREIAYHRAPEWVAVSERLPEPHRDIWITWGDIVFEGHYQDTIIGFWLWQSGKRIPVSDFDFFWCYRYSFPRPLPPAPETHE